MPIFYQQDIDQTTKLAIWKIGEEEEFFLSKVTLQRNITHPHKRLQHLAGRYLLKYLFPDFPVSLIKVADTLKPFLENEAYHFSISHCGDFAAVIVSTRFRVGVDIEIPADKVARIKNKFLHENELLQLVTQSNQNSVISPIQQLTLLWSCKEAVYKWWSFGKVDFRENIRLHANKIHSNGKIRTDLVFERTRNLVIEYRIFEEICLAWVVDSHAG